MELQHCIFFTFLRGQKSWTYFWKLVAVIEDVLSATILNSAVKYCSDISNNLIVNNMKQQPLTY